MPKTSFLRPAEAVRLCAAVAALTATLSTALAHGTVQSASPANGAALDTPPTEIRLNFSEALEPAFTSVKLLNAAGQAVPTPEKAHVEDGKTVVLPLPALSRGSYKAQWMSVGHDGHHIHGDLDFTVK